jgi:hypothetical protein
MMNCGFRIRCQVFRIPVTYPARNRKPVIRNRLSGIRSPESGIRNPPSSMDPEDWNAGRGTRRRPGRQAPWCTDHSSSIPARDFL